MPPPPIDWLRRAADRKLEISGPNIWKALRAQAYVQVIGAKGAVLNYVTRLSDCVEFRVTKRGHDLLESDKKTAFPFNKNDPPSNIALWVSSLRRLTRNCPEGLKLTYSEGELHVLVTDSDGKVTDDDAHRMASMKAPWVKP